MNMCSAKIKLLKVFFSNFLLIEKLTMMSNSGYLTNIRFHVCRETINQIIIYMEK